MIDSMLHLVSHYRHILATMQHGAENAVVQHYAGIDRRLGIARLRGRSFGGRLETEYCRAGRESSRIERLRDRQKIFRRDRSPEFPIADGGKPHTSKRGYGRSAAEGFDNVVD